MIYEHVVTVFTSARRRDVLAVLDALGARLLLDTGRALMAGYGSMKIRYRYGLDPDDPRIQF